VRVHLVEGLIRTIAYFRNELNLERTPLLLLAADA
jgi:hypothetical protein